MSAVWSVWPILLFVTSACGIDMGGSPLSEDTRNLDEAIQKIWATEGQVPPGGRAKFGYRRSTIAFMHVGKTGGTTFRNVIEENASLQNTTRCEHNCISDECTLDPAGVSEDCGYCYGHTLIHAEDKSTIGACLDRPGHTSLVVTILRDPIELHTSAFYWGKTKAYADNLKNHNMDPSTYYSKSPDLLEYLRHRSDYYLKLFSAGSVRSLENAHFQMDNAFDLVGVTEDFDSVMVLIGHRLGWPLEHMTYVKQKVIEDRPSLGDVEDSSWQELEGIFAADISIYRHAKAKLEQAKLNMPGFEVALARFKDLQTKRELEEKPEYLSIDPEAGIVPGQVDKVHSLTSKRFATSKIAFMQIQFSGGAPLKSFIENEARRRSWRQCQHRCIERQCTISSSVTTREECDYCVNRDMIKLDDLKDVKRCLRSKLLAEVLSIAVIRNPLERAIAEYLTLFKQRSSDFDADTLPSAEGLLRHVTSSSGHLVDFLDPLHGDAKTAKKVLSDIDLVGVTDRMDELLVVLMDRMGWSLADISSHVNAISPTTTIVLTNLPPQLLGLWSEIYRRDLDLYNEAREMFAMQVNITENFQEKYSELRAAMGAQGGSLGKKIDVAQILGSFDVQGFVEDYWRAATLVVPAGAMPDPLDADAAVHFILRQDNEIVTPAVVYGRGTEWKLVRHAFCKMTGFLSEATRFYFNGDEIVDTDTVESLGLYDQAKVRVKLFE